jgi:hypothetical protein
MITILIGESRVIPKSFRHNVALHFQFLPELTSKNTGILRVQGLETDAELSKTS